eukprot:scaffold3418_cov124-Isochrysis_galbana.AAC.23
MEQTAKGARLFGTWIAWPSSAAQLRHPPCAEHMLRTPWGELDINRPLHAWRADPDAEPEARALGAHLHEGGADFERPLCGP